MWPIRQRFKCFGLQRRCSNRTRYWVLFTKIHLIPLSKRKPVGHDSMIEDPLAMGMVWSDPASRRRFLKGGHEAALQVSLAARTQS